MTATFVEPATATWIAGALRGQLRIRLEREYLRLRSVERPVLMGKFDSAQDGAEDTETGRALAITDYRLAAISDFLRVKHEPHPEDAVCPDCCVLVDAGDGPRWVVLGALTDAKLPVVAHDSALGRAVIGARPGDTVCYPDPSGPRTARVIALESGDHS